MRRLLTPFGFLLIAITAWWAIGTLPAQEQSAKSLVEKMLENVLAAEGRSVAIDGLSIALNGGVSVNRVEVRDGDEPWLVLDKLQLDWRPLSLFKSTLEIDNLSIESIDLRRLPQTTEGGVSAPQEMSDLSNANIAKLWVGSFRIDQSVAGEEATIKIDGSAQIIQSPAEIHVAFTADRIDSKQGKLKAIIVLDPKSRNLDLDIALQEGAGGLVSGLLGLRGDPPVDLGLQAKGMIDNWTGRFSLDLDHERVLAGEAAAVTDAAAKKVTINGSGQVDRLAPAGMSRVLRGNSELTAVLSFPNRGGIAEIQRIWIDNDAYQLRVSGPVDWAGNGTGLTLELRAKNDQEVFSLQEIGGLGTPEIAGLMADIGVSGNLSVPHWTITANAASLTSDIAVVTKPGISLSGVGIGAGANPASFEGMIKGEVGQGRTKSLPSALTGALTGQLAGERSAEGDIKLSQAEVSLGKSIISATGRASASTGNIDLAISGTAQSPETGNPVLDGLLSGNVTLAGNISGGGGGTFTLKALKLSGEAISAGLNGTVSSSAADLALEMELPKLQMVDSRLEGSARGKATVKGPWAGPEITVDATGKDMTLLGRSLSEPILKGVVVISEDRPSGSIDFTGSLDGRPVRITGDIETAPEGVRILRNFSAQSNTSKLEGELRLPPGGLATGAFKLSSPDLRDVGPLLLMELAGSLEANVVLDDTDTSGRITVDFDGRNLRAADLVAKAASGDVTIASPFDAPRPAGKVRLDGAQIGDLAFSRIEVDANAKGLDNYDVSLKATGKDVSADAQVAVTVAGKDMQFAVARLNGVLRDIPVRAAQPFTFSRQGNAWSVNNAELIVGKGRASLDGRVLPDMDVAAKLNSISLAALEKITGVQGLAGVVSGSGRLTGTTASPTGRFDLSGEAVTFETLRAQGLQPLTFEANGSVQKQSVKFNASGTSGPGTRVTADGEIGLGTPSGLNITLRGKTDGIFLTERLAASGMRFRGSSDFDMRVTGSTDLPVINGNVSVAGATVGDAAGRFIIRDASGQLAISDGVLRITSLQGVTGKNGRAIFSGTVSLVNDLEANLKAEIENGIYTDGTFVTSRYDGNLTLTGPLLGSPTLGGEIALEKTKITLSSVPPSALPAPDVKHRNAPAPVKKQAQALRELQGGGGGDVLLNLTLRARDPISVSGRGLNVTLGGRLLLTGTLQNISAVGAFRLQRGSLKLLARRLDFENGRLDFDDGLDPRINFVAVSRRTDATITLTISGRASAPDIKVTSSPQLPEEEAMARLIFDRSMLQLSPLQIAQIASYVATLSGGRDSGLLSGLQNALGTDWLEVIQTETGETALSVGKRLNDRLSVGVEQTTKTNTSRVVIDLGITSNFKARASVGTDGASRTGVYYEKDY